MRIKLLKFNSLHHHRVIVKNYMTKTIFLKNKLNLRKLTHLKIKDPFIVNQIEIKRFVKPAKKKSMKQIN